jgi:hypothetical protein
VSRSSPQLALLQRGKPLLIAAVVACFVAVLGASAARAEGGWGAFLVTSRVGAGVEFDSNPFGQRTNAISDRIYFVTPGLSVASRWTRHRLSADFEVNHREYEKSDIEATDFRGAVNGVFNVSRHFDVGFEVMGASLHGVQFVDNVLTNISFGNRDLPTNLAGLVPLTQWGERVWLRYYSHRLTNTVSLVYDNAEYGNAATVGGGTANLSFRSTKSRALSNQTDFLLSPYIQTFLTLSAVQTENPNAPERDAVTRAIKGGFDFAITPLISASVVVLYSQQEFDNAQSVPDPTRTASVGMRWAPLRYLTFGVSSTIGEEGVNFEQASSSSKFWSVGTDMSYGITKHVVFAAGAMYGHATRQTPLSTTRVDDDYAAKIALNYNFWRDAYMTLQHDWRLSKSSDSSFDLEAQVTRAEVRARF